MSKSRSEPVKEVYRASGEMEALVIKGLLESYGIPVILRSNAAPSAHYFTVDGLGEVRVMVPEEDADLARKLIEDRNKDNAEVVGWTG